jgi:hypothetical protein
MQMKPKLFAQALAETVAEAAARHDILDVGREARRIAQRPVAPMWSPPT